MKLIEIDGLLKRPIDIQDGYADDNNIKSFKGRTIETDKPIDVYRNLNKFIVNSSGKARAIKTMQRNVHAFIRGFYDTDGMGTTAKRNDLPVILTYSPFLTKGFHNKISGNELNGALFCIINSEGVKASYTH